jgi:hypothetical protein
LAQTATTATYLRLESAYGHAFSDSDGRETINSNAVEPTPLLVACQVPYPGKLVGSFSGDRRTGGSGTTNVVPAVLQQLSPTEVLPGPVSGEVLKPKHQLRRLSSTGPVRDGLEEVFGPFVVRPSPVV